MNRKTAGALLCFVLTTACTGAWVSPANGAETQPAATQAAAPPEVVDWLDRIQKKSLETKTLRADLIYDRNQGLVHSRQRRFGTLSFAAGPPKKFNIHFDSLLVDERKDSLDDSFIYDGTWLVERNGNDKTFTKRQLVPPSAADNPATRSDPLDSGEGPFVLPITTDKDRLLKRFAIELIPGAGDNDDPPNTVHLKLTSRPDRKSDLTRVDIWYDRNSLLPVRITTKDNSEDETVIRLRKVRVNEPENQRDFDTGEPMGEGWHVEVTPWENGR